MIQSLVGLHGAVIPQASLTGGIEAAAKVGFKAYEPEIGTVLKARGGDGLRSAHDEAERLGVRLLALNEIEALADSTPRSSAIAFEVAKEMSLDSITVIPAADSGRIDKKKAMKQLRDLQTVAREHELTLFFEMLCFGDRALNGYEDALQVAAESEMKLAVDAFHFIVAGAKPETISRIPRELIGVVHITDALCENKSYSELGDADRVLPGEGGLPLVEFMDAIRMTGYAGPMSVEVFHPKYGERDPILVAQDAYAGTMDLLARAGWKGVDRK